MSEARNETTKERYRPSNGDEGIWFMSRWCDRCKRDAAFQQDERMPGCPIVADTMAMQVDDPKYPPEWVEDETGPLCTAFDPEDDARVMDSRQEALNV